MDGQTNLSKEDKRFVAKINKQKQPKSMDPDQTYDERIKRFWHYMENKMMYLRMGYKQTCL